MEIILTCYFLICTLLAWRFLTGRSQRLDQKNVVAIGGKLLLSSILGMLFGWLFVIIFIGALVFRRD